MAKQVTRDNAIVFNEVSLSRSGHRVFDGLNLTLRCGLWHAVVGRSGVGKTSLLRLLATLEKPDSGQIETGGAKDLSRQIAYMSQEVGSKTTRGCRQRLSRQSHSLTRAGEPSRLGYSFAECAIGRDAATDRSGPNAIRES